MGKRSHFIFITLVAALINLLPSFFVIPAGDSILNYSLIDCYSKQFWHGILYPRWCMDSNGGMGSPGPIFYFPLPFYIPALFYPLRPIGLSLDHQYLLGLYLANVTAFACCVIWLRKVVRIEIAYLCAFIFLFCSYRSELLTRGSYAEYWCVSFMPLLFYYTRQLCQQRWNTWPKLAFVISVCIYCHAPATLIALMGAGLLVIYCARNRIAALLEFAWSGVLAGMLAAFHYVPMKLLEHTLNDEMGGPSHWQRSWVNSFIDQPQVYVEHQWALIGLAIGMLAPLIICNFIMFARNKITDADVYLEARCWVGIAIMSSFMLFSVSNILWQPIRDISGVITPWRMPSLITHAMLFCGAVMCQYVWQHRKTRQGDAILVMMFFTFSSLYYYGGVAPGSLETHEQNKRDQFIIKYFSTKDLDKKYGHEIANFYLDFLTRPERKQAEWVKGGGTFEIKEWDAGAIVIQGHANGANTLRLEHFHYPIWQALVNGAREPIAAENKTGRMLIPIPKGDFTLALNHDYWAMLPVRQFPLGGLFVMGLILISLGLARPKAA